MFDKVQRDRFWLVLGAVLIALFVVQKSAVLAAAVLKPGRKQGSMIAAA